MAVASEKLDTFSLTRDFFLSARRIMSSNIEGLLSSHEPRYALDFLQLCGTTVILRSSRASRWSLALRVELASVSIREPTRQCGSGWNRSLLWFRLKLGDLSLDSVFLLPPRATYSKSGTWICVPLPTRLSPGCKPPF
jgi:hypothetical protein